MSKCLDLFYMVRHGKVSTMIVTEHKSGISLQLAGEEKI